MTVEQLTAYKLLKKEAMPELNATGYMLKPKKTKPRMVMI